MDAGGRAVSGTKAEESSGLNNPFPHSGNDNYRQVKPNAASAKIRRLFTTAPPLSWIPAFAGMTARREKAGRHPDNLFAIPDACLTPALSAIPSKAGVLPIVIPLKPGIPRRHSGAGPPAWMQVVEPCLERRPRNPVIYKIRSRRAGMTTTDKTNRTQHPLKSGAYSPIWASPSSAACSRRRSTTCIHAGVDSGLRRNDNEMTLWPESQSL